MSDEVMTREEETGEDGGVGAEVQDAPTHLPECVASLPGDAGCESNREKYGGLCPEHDGECAPGCPVGEVRVLTTPTPGPPGLQVWQVWGRLEDTDGHLVLVASQDGRAVSIRSIVGELGAEGDMITLTPEGASAAILALSAYLIEFEAQGGKVQA